MIEPEPMDFIVHSPREMQLRAYQQRYLQALEVARAPSIAKRERAKRKRAKKAASKSRRANRR